MAKLLLLKIRRHVAMLILIFLMVFISNKLFAQNSLTGDGFGGRSWYVSHNYSVGSYTAFTVCGDSSQLFAWGDNALGQLGNGTLTSTSTPIAVPGLKNVQFHTGGYLNAAIKKDSTAWVWGQGTFTRPSGLPPYPVQKLTGVKFVDAGIENIAFVKYDSTVWGMGYNQYAQLGIGYIFYNIPYVNPVQMIGIHNAVRAISVGGTYPAIVILLADGTVKVAGGNYWFQITNALIPVTLPGLTNIVDIKGNTGSVYALDSAGDVYVFGKDLILAIPWQPYPTLGLGTPDPLADVTPPTKIIFPPGTAPIVALSAKCDGDFAMALDSNHNVYAWGGNYAGQCGTGTYIYPSTPQLVAGNAIDILAGESFSYILKADNTLWATGQSGYNNINPGMSGSIWMNLTNEMRNVFTQIDPTLPPMNLCSPVPYGGTCSTKINLGNDTTLCEGQKLNLSTGISNANYLWQDNSADSTFTVNSPGTYWVKISKLNCTGSDSIIVSYKPLPIVKLGNDTSVCRSETLTLHATNLNATYLWQDNSVISTYNVTHAGAYWVNVNLNGCSVSDTINIISKECKCALSIPNAITPNGDGVNDNWILSNTSCFQKIQVFVYNRYGSIVYENKDYQNDWQGTHELKPLPDGTYYYLVKVIQSNRPEQIFKGNLTLLR